jgi:RimJ/RimL family protein N-acetyltransferase
MREIGVEEVTPRLRALFQMDAPSGIRAFAVMEGGNAGRILTDEPARPRWAFVWEADDGTLYRGGEYGREELAQAIQLLQQGGIVALGFRDGDRDVELFPEDPDAGAECLEYDRPAEATDLSPYLIPPPGFEVKRMDLDLLNRSTRRDEKLNRFGKFERFLDTGLGVCMTHEGQIVSEAYADIQVAGVREIGIATQAAYRRQGLALITCAHLIQLCEENGSATYWDCAKFNAGSVALARRLGFQNERAYRILAWFKQEEKE